MPHPLRSKGWARSVSTVAIGLPEKEVSTQFLHERYRASGFIPLEELKLNSKKVEENDKAGAPSFAKQRVGALSIHGSDRDYQRRRRIPGSSKNGTAQAVALLLRN